MREWNDSQSKLNSSFRKLLKEQIDKANPRRKLAKEETIKLAKLEGIVEKLRRGENVQNLQLQTWLTQDECSAATWGISSCKLYNSGNVKLLIL